MTDTNNTNEVKLTNAEIRAEMARLQAANTLLLEQLAEAKKARESTLRLAIGEKGGVSLYGIGRFPTTLFKSQWLRLLDYAPEIRKFIELNDHRLAKQGEEFVPDAETATQIAARKAAREAAEKVRETKPAFNGASTSYTTRNGSVN